MQLAVNLVLISCLIKRAKKVALAGVMLLCASTSMALTGGSLVGLINGSDDQKKIARFYVDDIANRLNKVDFCRPYEFEPQKIFGALEIQLTYNPFFYDITADMLVREVLIKLTPCSKKSKTRCICLNRPSQ